MLNHWLLITFSWLGTARLQYINTGGPGADIIQDPLDSALQYPLPYVQYFHLPPTRNDYESHDEIFPERFYPSENIETESRNRRNAEDPEEMKKRTPFNFADNDKTVYLRNNELGSPFVVDLSDFEENSTDILDARDKKYFSPWGGKRDPGEHSMSRKRGSAVREPSMPKRVRFSPWGGKRSGHMVVTPGELKGSKVIYSSSLPELTRFVSKYLPLNFAGYQYIHTLDKRRPINILAVDSRLDERSLREAMPFKTFLESLPKMFKPGHPYLDMNLNKDGKRKVKFSAWGGKRSPPVIGPVWSPAPQELKDSTLNTILLIRNRPEKTEPTIQAL